MISNIFNIFQELYVRKGITPKYDLVQIEGAVHEPTFKYRVTVGDAVATGKRGISNKLCTQTKSLSLEAYILICILFYFIRVWSFEKEGQA